MDQQVTVSRELLRQVIDALNEADNVLTSSMFAESADSLRAALDAEPAPEAKPEKLNPLTQLQVAYVMGLRDANSAPQPAPVQEPEMHEAKCPALTGGKCNCPTSPVSIDNDWSQFCGGIGRGPDAPYPGMIEAFEAHYAQSFADRDWRNETGVWAAAWKAAKAQPAPAE